MQIIPFGPLAEDPIKDVANVKMINTMLIPGDRGSRSPLNLVPTPGLKEVVDLSGNVVRAIIPFEDQLFAIVDEKLYELTYNAGAVTATSVLRGTLDTGAGDLDWAKNDTQIMIVDGANGYVYTPGTGVLADITDPDFPGASSVVFLDGYFIFNEPDTGTMYHTAINDGTSIDALDVATAEGLPDRIVGLGVDKRELWVFGEESIEIWVNTAEPVGFVFTRRDGAFIDYGCAAERSIVRADNTLVWLDTRGFIVRANGYQPVIISNPTVSKDIQGMTTTDDAVAYTHIERGHLYYTITFPTEQKTWTYDFVTRLWHEKAYWQTQDDIFQRHLANNAVRHQNANLVGAYNSGKIYKMSIDYFDDGGETIRRLWHSPVLNSEFNNITINGLELRMHTGDADITGADSEPLITLRISNDGGHSWYTAGSRSIGKSGERNLRIRWNALGSDTEWLAEFVITNAVQFAVLDASIEVEDSIGV